MFTFVGLGLCFQFVVAGLDLLVPLVLFGCDLRFGCCRMGLLDCLCLF